MEGALTEILNSLANSAETERQKQGVSLVVHSKWIVPGVPLNTVLEDFSVVVNDGTYLQVAPCEVTARDFHTVSLA